MINRPRNSKYLLILIAVLLLANIVGIVFFLTNTNRDKKGNAGDRKNAMVGYLTKDLGFSADQMVTYDSLVARHRRTMGPLFEQMKKEKEQRLRYVAQYGFADTAIGTAVSLTAAKQQVLETQMMMHLKDVRNICNENQKVKFDSSIHKVFARKNNGNKPKK